MGIWQSAPQHRVRNAEHSRVRADAEGQREDGHQSKARILTQYSRAEAHVLNNGLEHAGSPCFTTFFFGIFDGAKFDPRAPSRFPPINSLSDQVVRVGFHVETQFIVHFRVRAGTPQSGAKPGSKAGPKIHAVSCHTCSGVLLRIPATTPTMRFHSAASLCNLR